MDVRGAARTVADLMFREPYQGDIYDERFHGFGRTLLAGGEEYVGHFVHGRRHGYGTAVWPDGLKHVGEWHRNIASGAGCLSWPGGALYLGDIRRGQRHGFGIFQMGSTKYIGGWRDGKRHGWGTQIAPEATYSGNWVDGHRHGWGTAEFASLNRYSGEWEMDKMQGYGTMLWVSIQHPAPDTADVARQTYRKSQRDLLAKLRGQMKNVGSVDPGPLGPFTPSVPSSTDAMEQYTGDWCNNKPHGHGEYTLMFHSHTSNRDVPFEAVNQFRGDFCEGLRHGRGEQHFADGSTYVGTWSRNLKNGPGTIYYADGTSEDVVMINDSPSGNPPQQARGGHGVGSLIKIMDLFEGVPEHDAEQQREDIKNILSRTSNTLHHLFNIYSSVSCPVEYHGIEQLVLNPAPYPPGPDVAPFFSASEIHVRTGCGALERNATLTAAITGKVVARSVDAAKRAMDVLRQCNADYEMALAGEIFQSPNRSLDDATGVPSSPLKSPSESLSSGRRPATPQVDVPGGSGVLLESLLPSGMPAPAAQTDDQPTDVRMSLSRFHAFLHDAQVIDAHFPLRRAVDAVAPLMDRLAHKPSKEHALSYPSFVEALVRVAHAKILLAYPFFGPAVQHHVTLPDAVLYLCREFFGPLCAALRDLDFCGEFTRLGVDRFVFEASENGTVEEIRRAALRTLRDKARVSKMKGDSPNDTAATGAVPEPLNMTVTDLTGTARLGETIAHLTREQTPAATLRRIERPSSAAIDALESMDLPGNSTIGKTTAQVRYKHTFAAYAAGQSQLEAWYVVVNIRHANVVHHRVHALIVQSSGTSFDARKQLVGVIPCAVLHRTALVLGLPLPSELRQFLHGAEGPHAPTSSWVISPPMPLLAHHVVRFGPVAHIIERFIPELVELHRHAKGRLWNLADFCLQLSLLDHFSEYSVLRKEKSKRQPIDVALRNVMFTAFATLVDDASSSVTAISECPIPPVYDEQLLRAFLKKTPELASALQMTAINEDVRRDWRDRMQNLRTPIGVNVWWSSAAQQTLSIEEFIFAVVQLAYLIYAAPVWSSESHNSITSPGVDDKADDPFAALETSSSMSAATSLTLSSRARLPQQAPVALVGINLADAVEKFSATWRAMLDLCRRNERLHPGSVYDGTFTLLAEARDRRLALSRKSHTAKAPTRKPESKVVAPTTSQSSAHAATASHSKKAHPEQGHQKASLAPVTPPPPPVTAAVVGRLGRPLPSTAIVREIPPILHLDKPLPIRPRATPAEDPKKKRTSRR